MVQALFSDSSAPSAVTRAGVSVPISLPLIVRYSLEPFTWNAIWNERGLKIIVIVNHLKIEQGEERKSFFFWSAFFSTF